MWFLAPTGIIETPGDWCPRSKGQQKMAARLIVCEIRALQRQDFRNFVLV